MHLPQYPLKTGKTRRVFEFVSQGRKGSIVKLVQFQEMDFPGFYNVAFGDRNTDGSLNDAVTTDNGDAEKVLATVVAAVYFFLELYPQAWVFATASSPARTRLYQRSINRFYEKATTDFDLMGLTPDDWEEYEKGRTYEAVAVCRKKVYL